MRIGRQRRYLVRDLLHGGRMEKGSVVGAFARRSRVWDEDLIGGDFNPAWDRSTAWGLSQQVSEASNQVKSDIES